MLIDFLGSDKYLILYNLEAKVKTSSLRGKKRATMLRFEKFPWISQELQKIMDTNMQEVGARRLAREAFKDIQLSIDHILFKVIIAHCNRCSRDW